MTALSPRTTTSPLWIRSASSSATVGSASATWRYRQTHDSVRCRSGPRSAPRTLTACPPAFDLKEPSMPSVPRLATTSSDRFDPDLADLTLFDQGPPHETFRRLREERPVHWNRSSAGGSSTGFWSVTRYDDIERASK